MRILQIRTFVHTNAVNDFLALLPAKSVVDIKSHYNDNGKVDVFTVLYITTL